jgi:hypothetical protein
MLVIEAPAFCSMNSKFFPAARSLVPFTSSGNFICLTLLPRPPSNHAHTGLRTPLACIRASIFCPMGLFRQLSPCLMLATEQGMRVMDSWGTLPDA